MKPSTKIGEPAVVYASKNTTLVSLPIGSGSSAILPCRLTSVEKDKLKCDHCGEKRHIIDTYWALHGVPDWEKYWRRLKKEQLDGKAHVAIAATSVVDVTIRHGHLTTPPPPPTLTVVSSTPTPPPPGVLHETTYLQTPQQNEVAECKNGQIFVAAVLCYLVRQFQSSFGWMGELTEPAELATPVELATPTEPAILIDVAAVTELIAPLPKASLTVPDQAPLDILENRGVPPNRYSPESKARYAIAHYVYDHKLSPECKAFVARMDSIKIPTRVEEAFNDPKWAEAMNIEMEALQKNNTWDIVDLPKGTKPVGCRWVFTVKYNADGTVERYKARLVAKGFTQIYEVDYQDTFAPMAKMNIVRVLLSLAINLDWTLRQFDVENAYLHGELEEEVYMSLPPRYSVTDDTGNVCKLKKALYGLKQFPRAWFGRFTASMKKFSYQQANTNHTLFIKHRAGKMTLLIIYVDDMIVTGDDTVEIEELQKCLAYEFKMKYLGSLKYFLGLEVTPSKYGLFLSQRKYVMDLLADTGMLDCKPADTLIVENHKLWIFVDQVPTNKERYQRLVGRLIYLSLTRPDMAYTVSVASQFMHLPSEDHMATVMHILSYLKSSPRRGLLFKKMATWIQNVTLTHIMQGILQIDVLHQVISPLLAIT
ncbi:transposable element gene [Prunus dulcis]|uniref:Transposable element protein n=1 Tax=Prunus dulcis TaxID=3755 RepID=A0A5H2XJW4_PRUDU|nr:transposable element gene [Prunus dulcis]